MQSGGLDLQLLIETQVEAVLRKSFMQLQDICQQQFFLGQEKIHTLVICQTTAIKFTWAAFEDDLDATAGTQNAVAHLFTY